MQVLVRASVQNTVVNESSRRRTTTHGERPANGEPVQIIITFTPPILLPVDHYFFRPEVLVPGGTFLICRPPADCTARNAVCGRPPGLIRTQPES
jgi:hypothetical protein